MTENLSFYKRKMTIVAILSMLLHLVYAFKPFEYMDKFQLEGADVSDLFPKIHVQSVLHEGLKINDSLGLSSSNAFHVIVSIMGTDPSSKAEIPLKGMELQMTSQEPVPCIIEQGNDDFNDCSMDPYQVQTFYSNAMGRVSFSIPLNEQEEMTGMMPPLLLHTSFMKENEW